MAMTTEAMGPVETEAPREVLPSPGEEIGPRGRVPLQSMRAHRLRARMSDVWLRLCPDCTREVVLEGARC